MAGVTVATVRNWEKAGKIGSIRTPGGQRRFEIADVRAMLSGEPVAPAAVAS
jgi:DNA-binding transcriptional MerR regulator